MWKSLPVLVIFGSIVTAITASADSATITVLKTSGCGCCLAWMNRLEAAGYAVTGKNLPMGELMQTKLKAGLKVEHVACHTGQVSGYVLEGHVPMREIRRLLSERPDAVGIAVPGMPLGSPGMDGSSEKEPFDVLLVRHDGTTETYARYP